MSLTRLVVSNYLLLTQYQQRRTQTPSSQTQTHEGTKAYRSQQFLILSNIIKTNLLLLLTQIIAAVCRSFMIFSHLILL